MNTLYEKDGHVSLRENITLVQNGERIFNPSEQRLLENGWRVYVHPMPEEISPEEQYRQRIIDLIRLKYSIDDELAIQRQRDTKPDEFEAYNAYVEYCKEAARKEIYGEEVV